MSELIFELHSVPSLTYGVDGIILKQFTRVPTDPFTASGLVPQPSIDDHHLHAMRKGRDELATWYDQGTTNNLDAPFFTDGRLDRLPWGLNTSSYT